MKIDLIYKILTYNENNSIYKIDTEEYLNLIGSNEVTELIDGIIFDRYTSDKIHVVDNNPKSYRFDCVLRTINELKNFIKIEENKEKFLLNVKSDIENLNQQTFNFNSDKDCNYTTLEYDIPNEWVYHHGGSCSDNRYKFIIKVYF